MDTNYFALLNLPVSFALDEAQLHRAYIQQQQQNHPDRLRGASEAERMKAMQLSADLNAAYRTLKSPLLRAEYLLSLKGIHVGSEKDSVKPSQALLMETMEMREKLAEAEDEISLKATAEEAGRAHQQTLDKLTSHFGCDDWDSAAQETIRLRYMEKFLEEARVKISSLKASHVL